MITHTNTSGASRETSEQGCDVLASCAYILPPKDDSDVDDDDGDDEDAADDNRDDEVDGFEDEEDDEEDDDDDGFEDEEDDDDDTILFSLAMRALGGLYVHPSGRQPMSTS